jgi:hypothetical protein
MSRFGVINCAWARTGMLGDRPELASHLPLLTLACHCTALVAIPANLGRAAEPAGGAE